MAFPSQLQALDPNTASIVVVSPPTGGVATIVVPKEITATLDPGRYSDALRVEIGGQSDLMFIGGVDADPFDVSTVPPGGWPQLFCWSCSRCSPSRLDGWRRDDGRSRGVVS